MLSFTEDSHVLVKRYNIIYIYKRIVCEVLYTYIACKRMVRSCSRSFSVNGNCTVVL